MGDNSDYKWALMELVSALRAKSTYIKSIDVNTAAYDVKFYDGMATAYHFMMDELKNTIEECDISLEEVGLDNYDPNEILDYKPFNYKKE